MPQNECHGFQTGLKIDKNIRSAVLIFHLKKSIFILMLSSKETESHVVFYKILFFINPFENRGFHSEAFKYCLKLEWLKQLNSTYGSVIYDVM